MKVTTHRTRGNFLWEMLIKLNITKTDLHDSCKDFSLIHYGNRFYMTPQHSDRAPFCTVSSLSISDFQHRQTFIEQCMCKILLKRFCLTSLQSESLWSQALASCSGPNSAIFVPVLQCNVALHNKLCGFTCKHRTASLNSSCYVH